MLETLGKKNKDRPVDDFYETPAYVTEALIKTGELSNLANTHKNSSTNYYLPIWEPACGRGAISRVLEGTQLWPVISGDIQYRGYGDIDCMVDFLKTKTLMAPIIVTNPPFKYAAEFVRHAKKLGAQKICLLLRLAFIENASRTDILEDGTLKAIYVFRKRVTMFPGDMPAEEVAKRGTSTTAYAWFVWDANHKGETIIRRI